MSCLVRSPHLVLDKGFQTVGISPKRLMALLLKREIPGASDLNNREFNVKTIIFYNHLPFFLLM